LCVPQQASLVVYYKEINYLTVGKKQMLLENEEILYGLSMFQSFIEP